MIRHSLAGDATSLLALQRRNAEGHHAYAANRDDRR